MARVLQAVIPLTALVYFCWSISAALSLSLLSLSTASLASLSFLSFSSCWRSSSALRRSSKRRLSSSFWKEQQQLANVAFDCLIVGNTHVVNLWRFTTLKRATTSPTFLLWGYKQRPCWCKVIPFKLKQCDILIKKNATWICMCISLHRQSCHRLRLCVFGSSPLPEPRKCLCWSS